ncbi:uncharacterized protein LOC143216244 [Lasioglossum baleicum]|uniref:uncharacterized protein LOC143216244 n=1 Tax=Lasioglossum baleicum TaxID=434251 RepID=UPI003FCE0701
MSVSSGSSFNVESNSFVSEEGGAQQSSALPAVLPAILRGRFYSILPEKCDGPNATARCNLCSPEHEIKGQWNSTFNFLTHLKRKHHIEYLEYLDDASQARRRNAVNRAANPQDKFEMNVARFIIDAMIPMQIVEGAYFKKIFKELDMAKKMKPISRRTIGRRINKLYDETRDKIKTDLGNVEYVCTTADIWSGKHRSFLGVTVHWITENYERKSAALGCRRFRGTHSYDRIKHLLHCMHREFDLDAEKIVATVTDNASNFVKAFNTFENVLPRHIRCAVHTLHLCVTSDLAQTIKRTEYVAVLHTEIMQKCNMLWKVCNRPKSSEIFKNVTGHMLKRPGDTIWNSLYDALQQIVELKPKLVEIGRALGLKNILNENDISYIEEHLKCTEPIAQAIDILQGDKNIFYGTLVPCLFTLRRKLRMLAANQWRFCDTISESLLTSLEKRFHHIFTFASDESKCAAVAALSHPNFKNRWFLCVDDTQKDALIKTLKSAVMEEMRKNNDAITAAVTQSTSPDDFFDFGESTGTEQVTDYSSKASLEILHYFEDQRRDMPVLENYESSELIPPRVDEGRHYPPPHAETEATMDRRSAGNPQIIW